MSVTISSGLTLIIPSEGDENWAAGILADCFEDISAHDHTAGGRGVQIATAALATDAVTDLKILLRNNQYLRGRNAANSADISMWKINASNVLQTSTDMTVVNITASATIAANALSSTTLLLTPKINAVSTLTLETIGSYGIDFKINTTSKWGISTSGHFVPTTDINVNIGDATHNVLGIYSKNYIGSGADITVGPASSHALIVQTNGGARGSWNSSGHYVSAADNTYDWGSSTVRFRNLYSRTLLSGAADLVIGTGAALISLIDSTTRMGVSKASPSHLLHVGGDTGVDGRLIFASTTTASGTGLYSSASNTLNFSINGATKGHIDSSGYWVLAGSKDRTTGVAANCHIDSTDGGIYRSTSSKKYKQDIVDLDIAEARKALNFRAVTYKSKCEKDDPSARFLGFIAEEVEEVEPKLVTYGADKEVEGLSYDRITVMLVPVIKDLLSRVEQLEVR